MSGIDEQDVLACDCKRYAYWTIFGNDGVIGYLNPDIWVKRHHARAVNKVEKARLLSKESFVNDVVAFRCSSCEKMIRKSHSMFDSLHRSVVTRWNVNNVRH